MVVVVVVTTLRKRVMMRVSQYEKIKGTYVVVFTEGARMSVGLWLDDIPRRKETDGQTATGDRPRTPLNVTMSHVITVTPPSSPHPPPHIFGSFRFPFVSIKYHLQ